MTHCVFCRIATGELPASKAFEDASTVAFMDLQSMNPGHVLGARWGVRRRVRRTL